MKMIDFIRDISSYFMAIITCLTLLFIGLAVINTIIPWDIFGIITILVYTILIVMLIYIMLIVVFIFLGGKR